jgi:ureidoacrylate peracid hydrolase
MIYRIKPALAIIDMQNGFMAPGGSYDKLGYDIKRYRDIIQPLKGMYRSVKSMRIPVFFSQALREKSGIDMLNKSHKILPTKRRERISNLPLCVRGTWDSEFIDELKPKENDLVVQKRRDSIFQDTAFELWLRSLDVDTILFSGIDTVVCVESSLRDAFNKGWDVILLSDLTASLSDEAYRTTVNEVRDNFGLVIDSNNLLRNLKRIDNRHFSIDLEAE